MKILEKQASDLAALIIDPLLANAGMIPVREGFLEGLREATARLGILLIFDEVISFRVAAGGAQERFNIRPDLTTLGKIIGGGLAVGAFGGRADVMNFYDPRGGKGRINHGGTFNANPLTMAGGVATMEQLTPEAYARLDALGERLRDGVRRVLRKQKYPRARSPAPARSSGCTTRRSGSATTARSGPRTPRRPRDLHGARQRGLPPLAARAGRVLPRHDRRRRGPLRRSGRPGARARGARRRYARSRRGHRVGVEADARGVGELLHLRHRGRAGDGGGDAGPREQPGHRDLPRGRAEPLRSRLPPR